MQTHRTGPALTIGTKECTRSALVTEQPNQNAFILKTGRKGMNGTEYTVVLFSSILADSTTPPLAVSTDV
jgi:hypothetical protein